MQAYHPVPLPEIFTKYQSDVILFPNHARISGLVLLDTRMICSECICGSMAGRTVFLDLRAILYTLWLNGATHATADSTVKFNFSGHVHLSPYRKSAQDQESVVYIHHTSHGRHRPDLRHKLADRDSGAVAALHTGNRCCIIGPY